MTSLQLGRALGFMVLSPPLYALYQSKMAEQHTPYTDLTMQVL